MTSDHGRASGAERDTGRLGVAAGVAAAVLYASTVVRGLGWDDAAELSAGIIDLGVVHQTGYPLYLLTGKAFTVLVPLVPDVTLTNLFSGMAAAACVGLVAWLTARHSRSRLAGAVAAAVLATGSLYWTHARTASVYPLYLALIAGSWAALLAWERRPAPGRLAVAGACLGALVISHRTGIAFAAAALLHVVVSRRGHWRTSHLLAAVAAGGAPLLLLLYLPWRTGRVAFPDGLEASDATVLQWATGTVPAGDAAAFAVTGRELLQHVVELVLLVMDQASIATVLLVPLGLWAVRRDQLLLHCVVAPAVLTSAVAMTTTGNYAYWHLPLVLVAAVLTGCGAVQVRTALGRTTSTIRTAGAVAAAAALVTSGVSGVAHLRSDTLDASAWAERTLLQLPDGAEVEAGWTAYTVLRATQTLDGTRPDVRVEEGAYWVEAQDLHPDRVPLLAAVSQRRLRSTCVVEVVPLGAPTQTNFKGLSDLRFAGVQLGYDAALAQLVRVEPPGQDSGCP